MAGLVFPPPNGYAAQEPVIGVHHAAPSHALWIEVQACKQPTLLLTQISRISRCDAKFLQPAQHHARKFPAAIFCHRAQPIEQCLIRSCRLVKHTRINCRREQIIGGSNGVNITRQM